jgi:hypothetical protein
MLVTAQMERSNTHEESFDQTDRCEHVDRLRIVDGLRDQVIIRGVDGSEIQLHGFHLDVRGYSTTNAQVHMSEEAEWEVPKVDGQAEGRFRRDSEAVVGEPFEMLFFYPEAQRRILVNLGEVSMIAVCPSSDSGGTAT